MTGYVRGRLSDTEGADELIATARESVPVAQRLGIPRLNLHGTGLDGRGLPVRPEPVVTGEMWLTAGATLTRIAELGESAGVTFVLENLNTAVDHPGVPFATAADCLALVQAVDSPHLRLMLDLYHAQIGEGNLIELCRRALPLIGEIQVADVPGRCEPGTGEIAYPAVAKALSRWATAARSGSRPSRRATPSWRSPASARPSPPESTVGGGCGGSIQLWRGPAQRQSPWGTAVLHPVDAVLGLLLVAGPEQGGGVWSSCSPPAPTSPRASRKR